MPEYSRQTITPEPFHIKELAGNNWKQLVVKLSSFVTCFRYLTSKIVYTDQSFTQQEAVVLFCAFEEMVKKIEKDPEFRQKYSWTVFTFRAIYQSLDSLVLQNPKERQRKLGEIYNFYRGKIVSRRYFYAVEGQNAKLYETFIKTRFPKKFPAKTFVAKGYGDHGTAKNKAFDGTPSWQEVAMANETESDQTVETARFFRTFQVHESQLLNLGTR